MFLSNNPNNIAAVQLDMADTTIEINSDHDNSMEDTLEAEISKLETTINDLEADNDLPDIDSCAHDLEEGGLLDSVINEEGELVDCRILKRKEVKDDKFSKFDDLEYIDGEILGSEKYSQNIEYNNGDKLKMPSELNECYDAANIILNVEIHDEQNERNPVIGLIHSPKPSKTLQVIDLTYSPEPNIASYQECSEQCQKIQASYEKDVSNKPELKIPSEEVFTSIKSVIISNNFKEVPFRSQDCEPGTNDNTEHLNLINRTDLTPSYAGQYDLNVKRNKICPFEINKDSNNVITRRLSLQDVDDDITQESSQESYLQVDISEFEDDLLYSEDSNSVNDNLSEIEQNGPLVSSTPCRMKADSLKRWKPKFLAQSFLILDEFGESSDQDQSACSYINSPVQNTSFQKVAATHSIESRSFAHNRLSFEVNEDRSIVDVKIEGSDDCEQRQVAFGEDGDLKVLVKMSDEANNDDLQPSSSCARPLPLFTNEAPVQVQGTQDICIPVMKAKSMEDVNSEARGSGTLDDDTKDIMKAVPLFGGDSTDNKPEGNTLVLNVPSESTDQNSLEQEPGIISKYDEDYVSNNPQENDDNNNPDWELLRKLETDEERYRATRMRWRNLVIPDPNQDLTYRNWRIRKSVSKMGVSASLTNNGTAIAERGTSGNDASTSMQECHRKRTMSEEPASIDGQPGGKRLRSQSCTAVFDVKLEQLRRNLQDEKQRIHKEEQNVLLELSVQQDQEKNYLQNFCYQYGMNEEMRRLHYRQVGDVERVHKRFDDARLAVDRANLNQIQILEKACEEVRAFHKFYQGLDRDSHARDALFLSETQLEELWETERLYDQYDHFYSS